jgi:hypothetical protein
MGEQGMGGTGEGEGEEEGMGAWERGARGTRSGRLVRGLSRGTGFEPVISTGRTGGSPVPHCKAATRRHTASLWATPQVSIGEI